MDQSATPTPEPDASAPRRSGRVVKAPSKFEPEPNTATSKRKRGENDDDDNEDDAMESDEGMSPDDDAESDQDHPAPRSRQPAQTSRAKKPSSKKPKINGHQPARTERVAAIPSRPKKTVRIETGEKGTGLFVDIFGSGDAVESVARQWLQQYQADNASSTADLVNCILQCAGCDQEVTTDDIHDPESIPTRLVDLQNVYQEQQIIDYPLISKAKSTRSFRDLLVTFFQSLIELLHETDILYSDASLIDNLHSWLASMSSSSLRPFRHTATTIALATQSGLVEVADVLDRRISNIEQQLQAAKKAKNKTKATEVQRTLAEATGNRKICSEAIQSFFDTVFVHRYRDVDPKIRAECVEALGSWIWNLPTVFMEPGYLRYLGWMLSDTSPTTRQEVLKQLARVFKRDAPQLGHFIDRFRPRLIEMATQDSELSVRVAAISVIDTLRDSALLEPNEIDAIGKLIFDNEIRIRKAVVGFFIACIGDVYEGKVEEIGGSDVLDEFEGVEDDDFTTPRKEWVNIKCLAETLAIYDAQIEESQQDSSAMALEVAADLLEATPPDTRISLAAQVLYEKVPEVKRWETLAGYLLFDHTTSNKPKSRKSKGASPEAAFKAAVAPSPAEESILLDVLGSAVKSSLGQSVEVDRHKKRVHRAEASESQEEIALELASTIPKLLNKFGAEPETAAIVLRMEHFLNLDIFQQLRQDSSKFESLLDEISTQFDRHDDRRVLSEATAALLHARQYVELEEMIDSRISVLWENTINSLRNFDKTYELSVRGNLTAAPLKELSTILAKISKLASISDCVDTLEAEGTSEESKTPTIHILSNIVHRGKYEPQEDEIDDLEDEVVSFSIKACQFYFMWKTRALSKLLSGSGITDVELDSLSILRQTYRRHLIETLSSRAAIDQVRLYATGSLCDLHLTFAILRPVIGRASSADTSEKYTALVQEIEPGLIPELISIFDATEKQYAKKANKDRSLNEPADNEDPVDDDEELSDDEDENLSKEERHALELKAEKALCELAAKYVLAITAKLLDQRGSQAGKLRRRLLRNQTKLGNNFKEVVSYLDEDKLLGGSRKPSRAAPPSKPKKAALSLEIIPTGDDEDEDEEEEVHDGEPEEGSREDLRRRELLDEDSPVDDEDEDDVQRTNDVDDILGD